MSRRGRLVAVALVGAAMGAGFGLLRRGEAPPESESAPPPPAEEAGLTGAPPPAVPAPELAEAPSPPEKA